MQYICSCGGGLGSVWEEVVNGFAFLQSLLHLNEEFDTVHHCLHQLHLQMGRVSVYMSEGVYSGYFAVVTAYYTVPAHLGVTQPVTVGDVIDTTLCGRVHSPSPAFLQLHLFQ